MTGQAKEGVVVDCYVQKNFSIDQESHAPLIFTDSNIMVSTIRKRFMTVTLPVVVSALLLHNWMKDLINNQLDGTYEIFILGDFNTDYLTDTGPSTKSSTWVGTMY